MITRQRLDAICEKLGPEDAYELVDLYDRHIELRRAARPYAGFTNCGGYKCRQPNCSACFHEPEDEIGKALHGTGTPIGESA